jgi:hypothetical protein
MNPGIIQISRPFAVMPRGLLGYQTPVPTTYPLGSSDGNITNGLVAWWKLDETSGTVVADSSGNGLNGTLGSGLRASVFSGPVDNCLTGLQASNQIVTVPTNALLNLPADFTLAGWVLPSGDPLSAQSGFSRNPGTNIDGNYNFQVRATIYNGLYFRGSQGARADVTPAVNQIPILYDGRWHHICATRLGSTVGLFLDGVRLRVLNGTGIVSSNTNSNPMQLRGPGGLDDMRVYNRGLSDQEVRALYEYRSQRYLES